VDVVAVGTGQALELGRRGDADVVLVHAYRDEVKFVADRHARQRADVMYNDFVIVGPTADPAKVGSTKSARDAVSAIAAAQAPFASRGDKSGTHTAELGLWSAAKVTPAGAWYRSLGQGMGETLIVATSSGPMRCRTAGRGCPMRERLPGLQVLLGGRSMAENPDSTLRNRYGVMAIDPDTHPGVNDAAASKFVEWLVSREPSGPSVNSARRSSGSRCSTRTPTNGRRPTGSTSRWGPRPSRSRPCTFARCPRSR